MTTARMCSGIRGLDAVLNGGFPHGQLYLVEGNPGAGKTTLGLQFLIEGARRGERCCYIVLSEPEHALRRMALSHGWDLKGVDIIESSDQDPASDYTIFHPGEVDLGQTSRSLFARIEELKPQRLVIDSLSEVRLMASDAMRFRRQLLTMRRFFDTRGITTLLLDFIGTGDDRQLQSLCHGIVCLEHLAPEYGGQRRRVRVVKLRESSFRDGFHDFAIQTGGLEIYPRLVAAERQRTFDYKQETLSTGVAEIDVLLGGGIDRSTTTLILGPAGVGKSTLSAQFAKSRLDAGEKVAFFIFDEVPNTLVVRGEGMGLGVRHSLESGRMTVRQVDPAQLGPGQFAHLVRAAVEEEGATMVVIDSVNGYQSAMPEEHHVTAHLHELLAFLNHKAVTTILIMTQAGILGSGVTSPIDLSYLADTVLLLRYFESRGEIRQAISVVKRRTGRHERSIRELKLDSSGVRVGNPLRDFHGIVSGQLAYVGATTMIPDRAAGSSELPEADVP